jgi:hypothetical protein
VDFSFAPVLDLDYATSSVIGDRAFHSNPDVVVKLAGSLDVRLKCSLWLCMFLWLFGIQTGYCYKQTRLYSFD